MKIDRDIFINAGINYIYDLDEYKESSVCAQVATEFDEILDLNSSEVLEGRSGYMGIGEPSDYLNHLIETDEKYQGGSQLDLNIHKHIISKWQDYQES